MFGICNLSIVPVRIDSSDKSEMCTQLLFGDGYRLIEVSENKKWIKIQCFADEYEGWIDILQHNSVTDKHFEAYTVSNHGICMDDVAMLDSSNASFMILYGSTLPFMKGRELKISDINYSYQGELYQNPIISADIIKFIALRYMHTPYLWGGKTIFGIDCSGFTQQVYKILGYKLFRDAYQQINHGIVIENKDELRVGDLAFFENELGKIVHVGMMLDNKKVIHAHGCVRIDILDCYGILNQTTKIYSHKLNKLKRILAFES